MGQQTLGRVAESACVIVVHPRTSSMLVESMCTRVDFSAQLWNAASSPNGGARPVLDTILAERTRFAAAVQECACTHDHRLGVVLL